MAGSPSRPVPPLFLPSLNLKKTYHLAAMELMNLGLCLSFLSFYPCLYPILRAPLCVDYRPGMFSLLEREKAFAALSLAFFCIHVLVYPLINKSSLFEIKLQAIFDGGRTASKRCPGKASLVDAISELSRSEKGSEIRVLNSDSISGFSSVGVNPLLDNSIIKLSGVHNSYIDRDRPQLGRALDGA
ncbi:hypothetical protein VNO80_15851 [Phaseolus coccineus]|uniref:Uncharacterized protein n=1 Tax=Phaseolus coccineus TaxID=3886 RepID=A0AAN9MLD2_PHACN